MHFLRETIVINLFCLPNNISEKPVSRLELLSVLRLAKFLLVEAVLDRRWFRKKVQRPGEAERWSDRCQEKGHTVHLVKEIHFSIKIHKKDFPMQVQNNSPRKNNHFLIKLCRTVRLTKKTNVFWFKYKTVHLTKRKKHFLYKTNSSTDQKICYIEWSANW